MKIGLLFAGQGSQRIGMGKDFYEKYEESREIFDKASELLGFDMKELCFENEKDINITEYTQPALLTVSVAILRVLEQKGIRPDGILTGQGARMLQSCDGMGMVVPLHVPVLEIRPPEECTMEELMVEIFRRASKTINKNKLH